MKRFLFALWLITSPALLAEPGDVAIDAYLKQRATTLQKQYLGGATTLAEWQAGADTRRQQYLDMLGLWPLPTPTDLHPQITGTVDRDTVRIEKLHFQSRPGLYVTGNLYRPKEVTKPLPTILYVCGHSARGRDGNKTAFQDHGMWFARNGYVCLIIDTLQLGEIPGKHHGTYNLKEFWWWNRGYTPAGVEAWNGKCAIDYLVTRPEVDKERIGVTGISGGGASTIWIAALDPRVKVAVPVSGMSDLQAYIGDRIINGHCDCMFLYNVYSWEWTTLAAQIAPRPLLFANSDRDPIFPMDANRRIIERLRKLYALYGKGDLVDEHVSPGGHDYRPDLRLAIFRFFDKHLKGEVTKIVDAADTPLPGEQLRVFATEKDYPNDAKNAEQASLFVPTAGEVDPKGYAAWRTTTLRTLRERPFRSLPTPIPAAEPVGDRQGTLQPMTAEEPTRYHLLSMTPNEGQKEGTILVLNPDEAILEITRQWAKPFIDERVVYAVLPRGAIPSKWTQKNPPNTVERSHVLLGTSVDVGRVRDVIATVRWAKASGGANVKWRVVGRQQAGVIAAYAAILDPTIDEVVMVDPPPSCDDGPYFLGIDRIATLPQALSLIAPRPLTLLNADAHAARFDTTAKLYEAAGAAKAFKRE